MSYKELGHEAGVVFVLWIIYAKINLSGAVSADEYDAILQLQQLFELTKTLIKPNVFFITT